MVFLNNNTKFKIGKALKLKNMKRDKKIQLLIWSQSLDPDPDPCWSGSPDPGPHWDKLQACIPRIKITEDQMEKEWIQFRIKKRMRICHSDWRKMKIL